MTTCLAGSALVAVFVVLSALSEQAVKPITAAAMTVSESAEMRFIGNSFNSIKIKWFAWNVWQASPIAKAC